MKIEKVLMIGGVALLGYFLYKRYSKPKAKIVEPNIEEPTKVVEEPKKTIVLDLRDKRSSRKAFLESFHKGFNASKESTVAPPMVKIQTMYNDL